ncbi:hypothetical protein [Aeromicrobium sp. Leaf350]|uniref:hypothetical protein n=1 Tax=Aeromicrobium sp. Leaf350 TaxID=2876565 RepID=UPI001E443A42|nr:hypothetical protein [Aeromicrobium sp. Leaf350]
MDSDLEPRSRLDSTVRQLDIAAKAILLVLLVGALIAPDMGNMQDKGAWWRAVGYPALAFTLPLLWALYWRERMSFPWLADLCITIPCFSDILGNRLDLYDRIWWFDDWMHFFNTGLLVVAVLLLTMPRKATRAAVLERSLAFGVTAALAWEIAEYFAFLHRWDALPNRLYEDTLGDLFLGTMGSLVAGLIVHRAWLRGRLTEEGPAVTLAPTEP